jgi:hypothetical protein
VSFYLFPFCRPRSPSQTTESLRYYRVFYLIIPEAHRNNGARQTVYRSKEAPTRHLMRKLIQSLLSGVQNAQYGPQGVNPGESLGLGRRSPAESARMCAEAVALDRFSALGATAQPANSSVKNATTVRLTAYSVFHESLHLNNTTGAAPSLFHSL